MELFDGTIQPSTNLGCYFERRSPGGASEIPIISELRRENSNQPWNVPMLGIFYDSAHLRVDLLMACEYGYNNEPSMELSALFSYYHTPDSLLCLQLLHTEQNE